jgi:hypothetical protein
MASLTTIRDALEAFAANYGRGIEWRDRVAPTWERAFASVPDKTFLAVLKEVMQGEEELPSLAKVKSIMGQALARLPAQGAPSACRKCGDGWRTFAWHHYDREDRIVVDAMTARCPCPAGRALRAGVDLEPALAHYRGLAGTVAVYEDPSPKQLRITLDTHTGGAARSSAEAMVAKAVNHRESAKERARRYRVLDGETYGDEEGPEW